jgi:membrane protein CcdC involved in cytochrome C biogenesis
VKVHWLIDKCKKREDMTRDILLALAIIIPLMIFIYVNGTKVEQRLTKVETNVTWIMEAMKTAAR